MITAPEKRAPVVETEKFNIESLINERTQKLYEIRLEQHIAANNVREEDSIGAGWTKIKNNIYEVASPEMSPSQRKNAKPWYSAEEDNNKRKENCPSKVHQYQKRKRSGKLSYKEKSNRYFLTKEKKSMAYRYWNKRKTIRYPARYIAVSLALSLYERWVSETAWTSLTSYHVL